ncbi:cytochrome P450 [Aaosphaeria arxii CBS 175.79]|uniref:Cytochrome P450 n=1 Tax=Aaosphaeria arxii CBS 175.79 TaxID=1450172 RepID=A0A6A5XD41_9PLEO|nr:cytochrome P450 [Aaosphaeria arxii CBS 175.79]KAF2010684.1 cytochrome P450 [Aaosphaeria arxii CBS 175.79]
MAFIAGVSFVLAICISLHLFATKAKFSIARWKAKWHHGCQDPPSYPHKDLHGKDLGDLSTEAYKERRFLDFNTELFQTYGPTFRTITGGKVWIKTKDPRLSKAIYSTFFNNFGLAPIRYEVDGFFGDGILVTDGDHWKQSRALIRPAFEIAHIANFERLHRHVKRFMELIPDDGSTIDLLPIFKRLTLDLSTEFIFGKSMNALSTPNASSKFLKAFSTAQSGVVMNPATRDKDWKASCELVHNYVDARVEEAISRVYSCDKGLKEESRYLRLSDELAKTTKDRKVLRYQVLSVFSPAHDSVAVTLGNLFFHLARNQSAWEELRKEILPTKSQELTYKLLTSYKYLNWALRETHRLTPIAQASQRECIQTCILPIGGGIDGQRPLLVEKGTVIETNFRAMQRDEEVFGKDAENFRPDRWRFIRPSWEFTPFSGGPRICPALRLVYIESQYIAASLIRRFSAVELRDPELRWVEDRRLIYQSRNGTLGSTSINTTFSILNKLNGDKQLSRQLHSSH